MKMSGLLGTALAVSTLVNVVLLARARPESSRPPEPAVRPAVRAAAPASSPGSLEALRQEVAALRREIQAWGEPGPRSRETASADPDGAAPPERAVQVSSGDEEVEALLQEQFALERLWKKLDALSSARAIIGIERQRDAALLRTCEFLGLEGGRADAFRSAAEAAAQELRRVEREHEAAMAAHPTGAAEPAGEARLRALADRYGADRQSILSRLRTSLDLSLARHRLFHDELDTWIGRIFESGPDGN